MRDVENEEFEVVIMYFSVTIKFKVCAVYVL